MHTGLTGMKIIRAIVAASEIPSVWQRCDDNYDWAGQCQDRVSDRL